jgi:hypothetical protein
MLWRGRLEGCPSSFVPVFVPVTGTMQNTRHKELRCNNLRWVFKKRAERTGFEPAEGFDPFTDLANRRFRPLSHLSQIDICTRRQIRRGPILPLAVAAVNATEDLETVGQFAISCHSRACGNLDGLFPKLDSRLRGNEYQLRKNHDCQTDPLRKSATAGNIAANSRRAALAGPILPLAVSMPACSARAVALQSSIGRQQVN